jgi:hypothetical protein
MDVPHEVGLLLDVLSKDTGEYYKHHAQGLFVEVYPPHTIVATASNEARKCMDNRYIKIHGATPMQLYLSFIHQIFQRYNPPLEYTDDNITFRYSAGMLLVEQKLDTETDLW